MKCKKIRGKFVKIKKLEDDKYVSFEELLLAQLGVIFIKNSLKFAKELNGEKGGSNEKGI